MALRAEHLAPELHKMEYLAAFPDAFLAEENHSVARPGATLPVAEDVRGRGEDDGDGNGGQERERDGAENDGERDVHGALYEFILRPPGANEVLQEPRFADERYRHLALYRLKEAREVNDGRSQRQYGEEGFDERLRPFDGMGDRDDRDALPAHERSQVFAGGEDGQCVRPGGAASRRLAAVAGGEEPHGHIAELGVSAEVAGQQGRLAG